MKMNFKNLLYMILAVAVVESLLFVPRMQPVQAQNFISQAAGSTQLATASFATNQNAGTYTVLTASVGAVYIDSCTFYSNAASAGLTSVTFQTDDTTAITVLGTTLLAALTAGKNLTAYQGPLYLPSGKHIQATIAGTGSGSGTIQVSCKYTPAVAGGTLG